MAAHARRRLLRRGDEDPRPRRLRRRDRQDARAGRHRRRERRHREVRRRRRERCSSRRSAGRSPAAARASGCRARSPPSPRAARCTSSRRAAFRGPKSTFPKTTGARAPRCCRPSSSLEAAGVARRAHELRARPPNELGDFRVMYERFYNLRERPFSLSPDPDYLYPSRVHTEALSYLRYGIEGHAGLRRHHRRHRIGQDDAAADDAARHRPAHVGRAAGEHDARRSRAASKP